MKLKIFEISLLFVAGVNPQDKNYASLITSIFLVTIQFKKIINEKSPILLLTATPKIEVPRQFEAIQFVAHAFPLHIVTLNVTIFHT